MKLVFLLSLSLTIATLAAGQPQKPKIFRPTYFHFGVNLPAANFGTSPVAGTGIKPNILKGNFGAQQGYLFELGTKIYFNSSDHVFRFGLDWTFISASYNKMDWTAYANAANATVTDSYVIAVASKLGPVFSYNITSKLVADLHFQAAPTLQLSPINYSRYYGINEEEQLSFTADKVGDLLGIKTSAGIGIRWGVIGLSADYFSGKSTVLVNYYNSSTGEGTGSSNASLKEKIQSAAWQVSLSLNL
jgi:hypothetical protein